MVWRFTAWIAIFETCFYFCKCPAPPNSSPRQPVRKRVWKKPGEKLNPPHGKRLNTADLVTPCIAYAPPLFCRLLFLRACLLLGQRMQERGRERATPVGLLLSLLVSGNSNELPAGERCPSASFLLLSPQIVCRGASCAPSFLSRRYRELTC
jgi:hypothetical protein